MQLVSTYEVFGLWLRLGELVFVERLSHLLHFVLEGVYLELKFLNELTFGEGTEARPISDGLNGLNEKLNQFPTLDADVTLMGQFVVSFGKLFVEFQ